jgi:hypothetical protein
MPRKKKVEPRRREVCNFIVSGDVDFDKFTCTKCGKPIKFVGSHGICCGIKFGVKRK